jgi:hypothetical protein
LVALQTSCHVGDQAFLRGFGQVVRQQQQALRAGLLGFLGVSGHAGQAADAGQDRHLATAGVHCGLDDFGYSCGVSEKNSPVPPAANSALAP